MEDTATYAREYGHPLREPDVVSWAVFNDRALGVIRAAGKLGLFADREYPHLSRHLRQFRCVLGYLPRAELRALQNPLVIPYADTRVMPFAPIAERFWRPKVERPRWVVSVLFDFRPAEVADVATCSAPTTAGDLIRALARTPMFAMPGGGMSPALLDALSPEPTTERGHMTKE